jgi:hypothetical protein
MKTPAQLCPKAPGERARSFRYYIAEGLLVRKDLDPDPGMGCGIANGFGNGILRWLGRRRMTELATGLIDPDSEGMQDHRDLGFGNVQFIGNPAHRMKPLVHGLNFRPANDTGVIRNEVDLFPFRVPHPFEKLPSFDNPLSPRRRGCKPFRPDRGWKRASLLYTARKQNSGHVSRLLAFCSWREDITRVKNKSGVEMWPLIQRIKSEPRITFNLMLFCCWIVLTPIAFILGWLNSVAFVSLLSLLALAITNLAAWLAELKLMKETKNEGK